MDARKPAQSVSGRWPCAAKSEGKGDGLRPPGDRMPGNIRWKPSAVRRSAIFAALAPLLLTGCGREVAASVGVRGHHRTRPSQVIRVQSWETVVQRPQPEGLSMTTRTVGWAVGMAAAFATTVLRTTDGGRVWINVSPKGGAGGELTLCPESAKTAWAAYLSLVGPRHSVTVYRTTDSGRTWLHGPAIPVEYWDGGGDLSISGQRGWLEVGEAGNANLLAAELFATSDGGLHWQLLSRDRGGASGPLPGFAPVDLVRPALGFTGPVRGGGLYASTDGGSTWTHVSLGFDAAQAVMGLPVLSGNLGLMWLVPSEIGAHLLVLRSANGGLSWRPARTSFPPTSAVDLLNGQDAVVVTPEGTIYCTTDGGIAWTSTPADSLLRVRLHAYFVGTIDFISLGVGWLTLVPRGSAGSNLLVKTVDGGINWSTAAVSATSG